MPHIHIASCQPFELPLTRAEVTFAFRALNVKSDDEELIAASIGEKNFFLLNKRSHGRELIKSDKITRPSPNLYIHKALRAFVEAGACEVRASNVPDHEPSPHLGTHAALKSIRDFAESFPTGRPVAIEVGFGSGRHLLHQAAQNPGTLYIGIEIHTPSIEQVLKQINIQKLDNILLLDYDARLFMELVPSNIVSQIFVHFPVPWDKKPHRRVIGEAFVNEAIRVLMKEGTLELRTDSDNYFQYSFETFTALKKLSLEIHKNRDIAITSKYEDRWRRMEKNIYDVTMHNEETSEPLKLPETFTFAPKAVAAETLAALNTTTVTFEQGFIHFERLYRTSDGRMMFRLSMGSFERPEHLYLLIGGNGCEYYPQPPLKSPSNHRAHLKLCELLYG